MSERWQVYPDGDKLARLQERLTVLETTLPLLRVEMDRQFAQLNRDNVEIMTLLRAQTKPHSDRFFWAMMIVGAVVAAVGMIVIANWIYMATNGRLS